MKIYQGFSLFELMITLSIILILTVSSILFYHSVSEKHRQHLIAMQLLRALEMARITAIANGENVILEPMGDWRQGYRLVQDHQLLYEFGLSQGDLVWNGKSKKNFLVFDPTGIADFNNGIFYYCDIHANKPSWKIVLNLYSRTKLIEPNAMGDLINDEGKIILC